MKTISFESMHLKPELLEMIRAKGFVEPTPIQTQTIPLALEGHDLMGQARTGTGKTASFGIPILNCLLPNGGLQALIVCPTRELSVQVRDEIDSLGRNLGIQVVSIYGGQSIELQFKALGKQPEIVVATPGRLLDHMRRGSICMEDIRFVVLDEADEMLDMGFLPDIELILSECPRTRQTFLFSATLPEEIRGLGTRFMQDPEVILIDADEPTVPIVEQRCYRVQPSRKIQAICRILDMEQPPVSLVFCRTKRGADELAGKLNQRGFKAEALHGDMSQRERDLVMNRFRRGGLRVLVATDLAARGLDVEMVSHVFNYDIPDDPDIYVHRIGRTGRAGRGGIAITLVEPSQIKNLRLIEHRIDRRIPVCELPVGDRKQENREDELFSRMVKAARQAPSSYRSMAQRMLDRDDAITLIAGALQMLEHDLIGDTPAAVSPIQPPLGTMVNIELPLGQKQGISPDQLVDWLINRTLLTREQIGEVDIDQDSTYVEIPLDHVDEVYQACSHWEYIREARPSKRKPFWKSRGKTGSMTGR